MTPVPRAGKALRRRAVAFGETSCGQALLHQAGQLLPRIARGAAKIAQHHALVAPLEPSVGQAPQHHLDVRIARVVALERAELDPRRTVQKSLELLQRAKSRFVHVHHLGCHDRPKRYLSDSYHIGKDSEIKVVNEPPTPSSLLNPSVAVVMSRAINISNWAQKVTTVADLVEQAKDISKELQSSEALLNTNTPAEATVQKLRDFCVALSKAAAEQRHSIEDTIPDHPYRR